MTKRTVIEGCAIATVDAAGTEHRDGYLVIEDDRIVAVGEGSAPDGADGAEGRMGRVGRSVAGSTAVATWRRPALSTAITTSTSGPPADSRSRRPCSSGWSSCTRCGL